MRQRVSAVRFPSLRKILIIDKDDLKRFNSNLPLCHISLPQHYLCNNSPSFGRAEEKDCRKSYASPLHDALQKLPCMKRLKEPSYLIRARLREMNPSSRTYRRGRSEEITERYRIQDRANKKRKSDGIFHYTPQRPLTIPLQRDHLDERTRRRSVNECLSYMHDRRNRANSLYTASNLLFD